jgi:AAHS family benzoate transporter-like MFS transporter
MNNLAAKPVNHVREINVTHMIDSSTSKSLPTTVAVICFLAIVFDGLDSALFGTLLPVLMSDMELSPADAGFLASIGHIGAVVGAVFFGVAADSVGRKKMLVIGLTVFTVFTAACGISVGFVDFAIYRFIAGIGLAGIVPIAVALVYEYTPGKRKALVSSVSYIGIAVGVLLSAVLSIAFLSSSGWRGILIGTSVCIILVPIAVIWLPESMSILVKKNRKNSIDKILTRADLNFIPNSSDKYVLSEEIGPKLSVHCLFKGEYARNTIFLGIALFCLMMIAVTLTTWITHVMVQRGFTINTSITFILAFSCSNFISTPLAGWMADRIGYKKVLAIYMPILFVSVSLIGVVQDPIAALICMFFAGFTVLGSTCVLLPYAGSLYPVSFRSTAMGVIYAIGRTGPIIGPAIAGLMFAADISIPLVLFFMAVPSLVAFVSFFLVKEVSSKFLPSEEILFMKKPSHV